MGHHLPSSITFLLTVTFIQVFAINTESSEIVWSSFYPNESLHRLFVLRQTSAEHPAECAVLSSTASGSKFTAFNGLTGAKTSEKDVGFLVKHAVMLPDVDADHRHSLMIIGESQVSVYPKGTFAEGVLEKRSKSMYWHEVNAEKNTITGYKVLGRNGKYTSEVTWEHVFPSTEKIDAFKSRPIEDTIFSPYVITPHHDVLYKYLNPNLLAVSTVSNNAPFFKGSKSAATEGESSVHMYCVDTVTGHIVYHVAHPSTTGPTNLALSDNWVVHTYWNTKHLRTELSVLELWEENDVVEDTLTVILNGIGLGGKTQKLNEFVKKKHFSTGENEGKTFSSFTAPEPQKEEQSFVFPMAVKTLAVSSTELGISSKDLLVGTANNGLYAMPRKFFDARRPLKQATPEEMEAGIMQYHPVLPMMPTQYLSYNLTIAGLRGIRAVPAGGLESTSLVLAYGVDMFFCRSAPSKTFDMLPEDFNFGLLLLTIVGLSVATVLVLMAAKRKQINDLWL